ncbi:MAG: hypothetical protein Q9227_005747 [Pyrenula ochraceoflavens]
MIKSYKSQAQSDEQDELIQANLELLHNGRRSDATLKCRDRTWKLHKSIICERNNYFRSVFEGSFSEANSCELEWEEEDLYAIEGLLLWLYTYRYPEKDDVKQFDPPDSNWEYHWSIWKIADSRQAPKLKKKAFDKLRDTIKWHWSEQGFTKSAIGLWEATGEDGEILRNIARDEALKNPSALSKSENFAALMEEGGKFAQDLAVAMMGKIHNLRSDRDTKSEQLASLQQKFSKEQTKHKEREEVLRRRDRRITEMRQEMQQFKGKGPPKKKSKSKLKPRDRSLNN